MEPLRNDVLFGRGQKIRKHNSGTLWKILVEKNRIPYRRCGMIDKNKKEIAKKLVHEVQKLDPPGRFLDRHNDKWVEVHEEKAIDKTMQALRYDSKNTDKIVKEEKFQETLKERIMQQSLPIHLPVQAVALSPDSHHPTIPTQPIHMLSSFSTQNSTLMRPIDALQQFVGTSFSEKNQSSSPASNIEEQSKITFSRRHNYKVDPHCHNEEHNDSFEITNQSLEVDGKNDDGEGGLQKYDFEDNVMLKGTYDFNQERTGGKLISELKTIQVGDIRSQQEESMRNDRAEFTKTLQANIGLLQHSIEIMREDNCNIKQKMIKMAAQMLELKKDNEALIKESSQLHKTHEQLLTDKELLTRKIQELQDVVER
mmetsp:Transcript_30781/g.46925  ORF Transcript_30781/g.46925 Transcript_30781/m.46925 type:complete len:368 (-) Transcript_30781:1079-2182(-)|eukprot:CAMPEP_0194242892 /NCGR_PEP_ID=MMETSP0158-20130606/8289_1 /TAXON_ID=33649 /ORGANISM="Thalassionema nitzschioides, Strain L26-B" /LENGTH=367 /DNA_ID=CAMNT_0038978071 /DNA_START=3 /DNA_END=1106 /DNA_ORIENTATION=+